MTVAQSAPPARDLQQAARDHLWLHFTRMGGFRDAEVPIIARRRAATSRTRTAAVP